jgi:hypothetical protein
MMTPVPDLLLFRFHTNQYRKQRHYHSEIRFKIFQTCLVRNLESESVCRVLMLPAKKEPRLNGKKGAKEPSGAGGAGQGSVGKGADKAGADCLLGSSWFVSPFASPVCASPVFFLAVSPLPLAYPPVPFAYPLACPPLPLPLPVGYDQPLPLILKIQLAGHMFAPPPHLPHPLPKHRHHPRLQRSPK